MRRFLVLLVVGGVFVLLNADAQTSTGHGTVGPQRLSPYMRDAGLLYIETLERASEPSRISRGASDAQFESVKMLDDRIAIHATRIADKEFFEFLKLLQSYAARNAAKFSLIVTLLRGGADPNSEEIKQHKEEESAVLQDYVRCKGALREAIKVGQYSGYRALQKACLVETPESTDESKRRSHEPVR